jgi:subtilase family serine protease
MSSSRWLGNVLNVAGSPKDRRRRVARRRAVGRIFVPRLEQLEDRITPTGTITITSVSLLDASGNPLTTANVGQQVYVNADYTMQGLPSNTPFRLDFTVNGFTKYDDLNSNETPPQNWGSFIATPGTNNVTVTVDPSDPSSYTGNSMSTTFDAVSPTVGFFSYSAAQIRAAYGISSIPNFGTDPADGSGQIIAIVDPGNDPSVLTDLDAFDQAMSLTPTSTQTLYQQYGAASSFLTVYDQNGDDITSQVATGGPNVPPKADDGGTEEALDVEWAHAIAPGAQIDLIESNSSKLGDLFTGVATAAKLRDAKGQEVSVVSTSWGATEGPNGANSSYESSTDSSTLVTPSGHTGITFLASTGDNGSAGSEYPSFSPHVVAVGGTDLVLNNDVYGSETAWSSTLDNGSSSYSQTGTWTAQSGGFGGSSYSTAPAGSDSLAYWTTPILNWNQDSNGDTAVYATWTANKNNATNAVYQIYDGNPDAPGSYKFLGDAAVDQTKAPNDDATYGNTPFQLLTTLQYPTGKFPITNTSLTVKLSASKGANGANPDGTVVADAIGIAPAGSTTGGGSTGGAISQYETEPSGLDPYPNTTLRTTPDVAFYAGGNGGAFTYVGGKASLITQGTSLSCPCWAGLIAIADQGRATLGLPTLDSTTNSGSTLDALYSLPASDFHDITSGYNGNSAGSGYDLLTGRGSPIANLLVPDLVNYGVLTITTNPSGQTATAGGTAQFTASVSSNPTATSQWQVSKDGGKTWSNIGNTVTGNSPQLTLSNVTAAMNGYEYQAVFSNGIGTPVTTTAATLTVQYAPTVTTNPSDQTATVGSTVTFAASVSSNPTATAQWQVSKDSGKTWSNIANAVTGNSVTLTLSNVTTDMNGYEYQAVFTNAIGTTTTSAATLTIQYPPTVTTNPSDQTVTAGDTATFKASVSGNPTATAQWQVSKDGGNTWSNIGNAITGNSVTLTLSNITADMNNYEYEAVFSNGIGTPVTTTAATLTVQYAPTVTTQPADQTVTVGQQYTFTAAASGNPTPTVQWYFSSDGGTTWNIINGATSATQTFAAAQTSFNGELFEAVFSNGIGTPVTTTPAMLTVLYAPTVTTNPNSQTVTAGQTATFTAAATGNLPPTVQWQVSSDGGNTWTNISGATSTTLTLSNISFAQNGYQYRAVFTNSVNSANSNAAVLTVYTVPVITSGNGATFTASQGGGFTVTAAGFPTPTFSLSGGLPSGVSFTDNGNGTATLSGTPDFGAQGTYSFTIFAQNATGILATQSFVLTVNRAPAPALNVPSLLALFDSLLGAIEKVNDDGTVTLTDSLFGTPLLVATFDRSGHLEKVTLLGIDVTFLFG